MPSQSDRIGIGTGVAAKLQERSEACAPPGDDRVLKDFDPDLVNQLVPASRAQGIEIQRLR